jgi:hypothetical protein
MTGILRMNNRELQTHAGNTAFQVWKRMPEPKLEYIEWYYGKREQSLSEALERVVLPEASDGN